MTDFEYLSGSGIKAKVDGCNVYAGNRALVSDYTQIPDAYITVADELSESGKTHIYFALDGKFIGIIALSDALRDDSAVSVGKLKDMGIRVVMLTGDNPRAAKAIGDRVGIDEVLSEVRPDEKEEKIRELQALGRVCMVGDGINDAPSLTRADVGVAIGGGTDVAIESADVVLVKSKLTDVVSAIYLSRAVTKNIYENLFWAFGYNVIGIPLAAGLFIPLMSWELQPMFGAAAMSISSFLVVSNALRLNFIKVNKKEELL